jgi:hypothetical protein
MPLARRIWMSAVLLVLLQFDIGAATPIVWSGLSLTFTRPATGASTVAANQDRITDNVWLTRDNTEGIYNIKKQTSYDKPTDHAPTDTEWATGLNNPGKTISAANHSSLSFTFWRAAYNGGGHALPGNIVNRDAVLHLITDDIYLDIKFTSWGSGSSTALFSYMRAVAPPPTGDYNGNLVVDAADYTVWRDTLGQTVVPKTFADGSGNGTIDNADYSFWVSHFGTVLPAAGSGAAEGIAAPEPRTAPLIAVGLLAVGTFYSAERGKQRPRIGTR